MGTAVVTQVTLRTLNDWEANALVMIKSGAMRSPHRLVLALSLAATSVLPSACGVAGGEALSDGGSRFPDARVGDAGRVRNRDASTRRDGEAEIDSGEPAVDGGIADAAQTDAHVPGDYTWYRDIQPIIHQRCGLCHTSPPMFGAPRSLMNYRDLMATNAFGQPVHELVAYRLIAGPGRMPPAGQPEATEEEIQKILDWSALGAPMGAEPADSGVQADAAEPDGGIELPWSDGGTSPSPGPGFRYVDLWGHAENDYGRAYVAERGTDGTSYICFAFDLPDNPDPNALPETIIAFEPFIDNYLHVHHIFAYAVEPDNDVPDGPYNCILGGNGRIIGSWFPGRGNTYLPEGVGVPVTPGMRLNMQIHFDSVQAGGAPDMSGIRLLLTQEQGLIQAGETWAGIDWPMPNLGPGRVTMQSVVTNTYDNVTIFTATPHMHAKGQNIRLEYRYAADPANQWRTLRYLDPWDFTNQILYDIEPPLVLNPGDQLRTTCEWDTANGPIIQGQSSDNEMCYWFLYHYRTLNANPPLLPFYNFVGYPQ